ncbi:MAG: hypothetical protein AAF404_02015 [Pseudomonadota bacterium]
MDTVSSQTNYIVVPPSTPNDEGLVKKISQILADIEDIKEAHLPCLIEFGKSTQLKPALFVVVSDPCDRAQLYAVLDKKLNRGFFNRNPIEIKVVPGDFALLQSVRDAQCLIGWRD